MSKRLIDAIWAHFPTRGAMLVRAVHGCGIQLKSLERLRYQSSFVTPGRHLRCWWSRGPFPGNIGDLLTPILLKELFGVTPIFCPSRPLLGAGSTVHMARANTVVWGSGLIDPDASDHPMARYVAVRGPLTREILRRRGRNVPAVYGDPAILMPLVHQPIVTKVYKFGLIPHYRHLPRMRALPEGNLLIDVRVGSQKEVFDRIDQIAKCEIIASSSLHGLILAAAYGCKVVWLRDSNNRLVGDKFKFRDFFASIGIHKFEPVEWSSMDPPSFKWEHCAICPQIDQKLAPALVQALVEYIKQEA